MRCPQPPLRYGKCQVFQLNLYDTFGFAFGIPSRHSKNATYKCLFGSWTKTVEACFPLTCNHKNQPLSFLREKSLYSQTQPELVRIPTSVQLTLGNPEKNSCNSRAAKNSYFRYIFKSIDLTFAVKKRKKAIKCSKGDLFRLLVLSKQQFKPRAMQ